MPATVDGGGSGEPDDVGDVQPGVARGASTLTEVIDAFAAHGYRSGFQVVSVAEAGPRVRCLQCHSDSPPASLPIGSAMRLEGASDPDEMMLVVAMTCPVCGARGTLTLAYGPMASAEEDDVTAALDLDARHLGFS